MNTDFDSLIIKTQNILMNLILTLYNTQNYDYLTSSLTENTVILTWVLGQNYFNLSMDKSGNYWLIHIDGNYFYLLPRKESRQANDFSYLFNQTCLYDNDKLILVPIIEQIFPNCFSVKRIGKFAQQAEIVNQVDANMLTPASTEVNRINNNRRIESDVLSSNVTVRKGQIRDGFTEPNYSILPQVEKLRDDLLVEIRKLSEHRIEHDRSQGKTVSVSAEIQELKGLIFSEFERIRAADNTNILSKISQLESKIDSITDSFSAILQQSAAQVSAPKQSAIVVEDAYEQPLNTESNTPYDREKYSTGSETESQNPELEREIQKLLQNYHQNPDDLERRYSIGVSETRESFEKRWSGLNVPIVLEGASNYNFIIVSNYYLLPKPNSKITQTKLNTIDGLFEYQNFRSGAPFQVIQPAIVTAMEGDRWQVTQKGKLNFLN